MANPNPNWPSFPGLANLTKDADGRPQLLDLIPGRQRGTPLNSLLFNPLIRSVCDLHDVVQGIGDFATLAQLQNYLSLGGGTLTGDLIISGQSVFAQTVFGGKCVSVVSGYTANSYLQTQIVSGKPVAIIGLQDNSGGWHNWVFDAASGSITRPDGKQFAVIDDVSAERSRAQAAESGLQPRGDYATKNDMDSAVNGEEQRARAAEAGLLPLTGGTLTGDLTLTGNTWENNLYGRTLHSKADNSQIDAALQLVGTRDNPVLSLRTVNESGGWQQWSFNSATGNVVSPGGGVLPEVLGMSGRVVIQNFIATVSAEQGTINFPNAFKPGTSPFVICVATTDPGTNFRGMTAVRQDANRNLQITNIGFDYFIYNGTNTSRSVPVLAIGIM